MISTKGACVLINPEDRVTKAFEIIAKAQNALDKVISAERGKRRFDEQNKNVETELNARDKYVIMSFTYKGEYRRLFFFFACDGDQPMPETPKLLWTLTFWGNSVELVSVVGSALKEYGEIYIDENNSSDVGFKPLNLKPIETNLTQ